MHTSWFAVSKAQNPIYQPYQYNFSSIDIPEVVQDCGAGGDCFYRRVTKCLQSKIIVAAHFTIKLVSL